MWHFAVLGTLVLWLSGIVYYHWRTATNFPSSIPVVGVRNEVLSKPRAWIREPERVLNHRQVIDNKFAVKYFTPKLSQKLEQGIRTAVGRDLTRNLENTQRELSHIIREQVDTLMGLDDSWHQVSLIGVLQPVISSVNYRMLVGAELCRNKTFTESMGTFGNLLGLASILIGQYVPFFLAPVLGTHHT